MPRASTPEAEVERRRKIGEASRGRAYKKRSVETRNKTSKASLKNWSKAEYRAKRRKSLAIYTEKKWEDPEEHIKQSAAMKKACNTPEAKESYRRSMFKRWADSEKRTSQCCAMKKGFNTPAAKANYSHSMFKRWADPEFRAMMCIKAKERWLTKEYQEAFAKGCAVHPNNLEQDFRELLETLFPSQCIFTGDFSFWIGGKNPDFCLVGHQRKCIEVYGDYWHKGDDPQDRINHFNQQGWECLVIWESEFRNSKESVCKKLAEFVPPKK